MDDMIRMKNTKFAAYDAEIDTLKQTLSKHVKENESLLTTLHGFKTEFKQRESKSIDKEIFWKTRIKNWKTLSRIKPTLYDGNVLSKTHDVIPVVDDEETLILAEKSRLKMVENQNDPIMKKEKINITPINYSELNKLSEDFKKRFVPQQELSAEQMFWLQSSDKNSKKPSTSNTPVKIEVPSELPKLKDFFKEFDKGLLDEISEVQTVFTQMEAAMEQCFVDRKCSQLQAKDIVIRKLKETIHSLRDNANPARVKQDVDEIETINIELEHKHCDSLIDQLNSKSMENADLKCQIQEKVFVTTTLQNELRRLKDKNVLDNATTITNATIIALVITEYLVNISKRRAFWSLNEDILKITVLTTNTPYPSRKIRCICACTNQRPRRKHNQYAVSREDQYTVLEI
ncbi:hypothetical protein Tco_0441197 [Tanacetum coccineum]